MVPEKAWRGPFPCLPHRRRGLTLPRAGTPEHHCRLPWRPPAHRLRHLSQREDDAIAVGARAHQRPRVSIAFTSCTRRSRSTVTCAWRSPSHSARLSMRLGQFRAAFQILQRHLAGCALVRAFDHRDGRAALIGIFQLVAKFACTDISFGAQACFAQFPPSRNCALARPS